MTSAQVVEMSVNVNVKQCPSQDYTHPDDRTLLNDLFNIGSSFSYEAGINGNRRCALYPPPSVSAPFYGYLNL